MLFSCHMPKTHHQIPSGLGKKLQHVVLLDPVLGDYRGE